MPVMYRTGGEPAIHFQAHSFPRGQLSSGAWWPRLSCHRFRSNEVSLRLASLDYNPGKLWRRLGLPGRIKNWSLTSLQQRLMKTGGRLVELARYFWLVLAEGHLTRRLFGEMLAMLAALPAPRAWRDERSAAERAVAGRQGWSGVAKVALLCPSKAVAQRRPPREQRNTGGTRSDVAYKAETRCSGERVRLRSTRRDGQNGNPG